MEKEAFSFITENKKIPAENVGIFNLLPGGLTSFFIEWGIVDGNDSYLYGEKVRAYLRREAILLPGQREVPDDKLGYGALCVGNSLGKSV